MFYRLILLALVAAAAVFAITIFFQISTIEVTGESRYTAEEIRQALGIAPGDNLFFIDKYRASQRLFDQLVYLDEVNIHRRLPDTLVVEVKDSVPVSALTIDGTYYLLDRKGKILEATTAEIGQGHVMIYGVDAQGMEPGDSIRDTENGAGRPGPAHRHGRAGRALQHRLCGRDPFVRPAHWLQRAVPGADGGRWTIWSARCVSCSAWWTG